MSGGLRTSVKGPLIARRLAIASNTLLENETINNTITAPLDSPPHPVEETTMDSTTNGYSICDGNIPCFPILSPATKNVASYWSRTRAESLPPQGYLVLSSSLTEGEILQSLNLKSFHFNELKTATRNFRPDSTLGDGGFGSVFKGWIKDQPLIPSTAAKPGTGMAIVIKHVNQQRIMLSPKEWMEEVNCLGQLSHPNLVKLIGYCLEDGIRLLVYEFIPKGSLENHLFRKASRFHLLSWNLRIKIALGAAKALSYLHSDEAKCIYVDFETSKILLDINYNVKLYGHGLAEERPDGYRSRLLNVDGLPWYENKLYYQHGPYTAPEYICLGAAHLTPRSDVYSFGVVLLEILSGRRANDRGSPIAEHGLVQLAKVSRKQTFHQIIDNRMEGHYSKSGAFKALQLAIHCVSVDPRRRPDMHQVVEVLENLQSSGSSQNESGQNMQGTSSNDPKYHHNRINPRPKTTAALHHTATVS